MKSKKPSFKLKFEKPKQGMVINYLKTFPPVIGICCHCGEKLFWKFDFPDELTEEEFKAIQDKVRKDYGISAS